ncbi:hypothetical protein GCM10011390_42050 [Aureimonas endophytica]|uniref:Uncharacterized protein n=1 Tax=Aureimonas endophytica TaxID=2027858 RepID=A0A916ZXW9_9HYPH|nr:hypothetical protein [Aureimonas endophytica]GGE18463.1 hypothetical protein GCM10011390_42050 [Aureimonas endophytica]
MSALAYSIVQPRQGMPLAMQLPAYRQAVAHEKRRNAKLAWMRGDLADPLLRDPEIIDTTETKL